MIVYYLPACTRIRIIHWKYQPGWNLVTESRRFWEPPKCDPTVAEGWRQEVCRSSQQAQNTVRGPRTTKQPGKAQWVVSKSLNLYSFTTTIRIQVCPKKGIISTILFWGWDCDHQSYSREGGSGFLGIVSPLLWGPWSNWRIFVGSIEAETETYLDVPGS